MRNCRLFTHVVCVVSVSGLALAVEPAANATEEALDPPSIPVQLAQVDTLSPGDAWAVGTAGTSGSQYRTYAAHWDGSRWGRQSTVDPDQNTDVFTTVSVDTTDDAWTAGYTSQQTLVEHYDGTTWSVVATPDWGINPRFTSLDAVSPTDVWGTVSRRGAPLVVHYDGSQWTIVTTPPKGRHAMWREVTMSAGSANGWLIGNHGSGSRTRGEVMTWDGATWTKATVPMGAEPTFSGLSEDAPSDVWIVGDSASKPGVILHWDGTTWTQSSLGRFKADNVYLNAVSADSPTDVWVTGTTQNKVTHALQYFILHWNGTSWVRTGKRLGAEPLSGVSATSSSNAFVASIYHTVAHWNGVRWTTTALKA